MKITHTLVLCFASAPFLAACGSSGTGVDTRTMTVGSFVLAQVDGAPLPIVVGRIVSVTPTGGTTTSCTASLTAMNIDITASGGASRGASSRVSCDDGRADQTTSVTESGTVSKTADGLRFDFVSADGTYATRYYGQLNGATLIIVRREAEMIVAPPGIQGLVTTDLAQLVFNRR